MKSYDSIPENVDLLLDLPFREGTGAITTDIAKPHHKADLKNTPIWDILASGLGVLTFDGVNEYAEIPAADSADLDFTSGDYSVGGWFYRNYTGNTEIFIAKYQLDVSGWEIYVTDAAPGPAGDYLTLRHHHAGGTATRTACYSLGWPISVWHFLGISRSSGYPKMFRNGEGVDVVYAVGGLEDPETAIAKDTVIGTRFTKDTNFWDGSLYRPRVWSRALEPAEWKNIFERERALFGV